MNLESVMAIRDLDNDDMWVVVDNPFFGKVIGHYFNAPSYRPAEAAPAEVLDKFIAEGAELK